MKKKNKEIKKGSPCINMVCNVSEFLHGELPPSEMERLKEHVKNCPVCSDYLYTEEAFESHLKEAMKEETLIHDISKDRTKLLTSSIMEKIKNIPQVKEKTPLHQKLALPQTKFIPRLSKKTFVITNQKPVIVFFSLMIVGLLTILYWGADRSDRHVARKPSSEEKSLYNRLSRYGRNRSIGLLYGYTPQNQMQGYLIGIADHISQYNPSLRETIIYKLKGMKIIKKRVRRNIKIANTKE